MIHISCNMYAVAENRIILRIMTFYSVRDKGAQGRELGGREVEGGRIKIGYDMICRYDMI